MESPRPVPSLTSDLLAEIFVRIGSPADLVRASTACAAFRRLITDPSFLRRYRSLHPPQLLGFIDSDGGDFQPVEAPHPSAAVGRAVARAGDFSFNNYLPRGTACRWIVQDVRDGRVLLKYLPDPMVEEISFDLAVYDPLARRCLLLPPIPDDLLASVQAQKNNFLHFDALLVPSMDEEDGASFKVIAVMLLPVFFFSSVTGQWSALRIPLDEGDRVVAWFSNNTYGCFYCCVEPNNKCFKFDMSSMEFSVVDLPPGCDGSYLIIVEAGEGRLGMFILINYGTSVRYTIWQIGGEMHDQSKMDNTILPLPVGYYYTIDGPYEGHIIISGYPSTSAEDFPICFTVEIKTLKIERVCQIRTGTWPVFPYFVFPPSMSQRRL